MSENELYEVERLISKRKCANNRVEYLVRWKGYSKKHDTWEPLSNLSTCMDMVKAFNAVRRRTRTSPSRSLSTAKQSPTKKSGPTAPTTVHRSFISRMFQNGGADGIERSSVSIQKRRAPRMIAPLLSKRANTNSQPKSLSPHSPPTSPRRQQVSVKVTPISARAFSNFVAKRDGNKLQNGYVHTSPPSSDHEYFSSPYKGQPPSWRNKRGETPSTSGSDDTDVVPKSEKVDESVIIDVEPAELPCGVDCSKKSGPHFLTQDGFLMPPDGTKILDAEALGRKLTLRGRITRHNHLHVLRRGMCTEIILSNEAERNVLSPETLDEFSRLLDSTATGPSTMVLFSAVGDFFCSGFDLKYLVSQLASTADVAAAAKTCAASIRNFVNTLIDFPKPIVAMVQGPAIGLGCAILPHFDTVYSSDRAYFTAPYAEMGQTPEACSSYLFPQIAGHSVANDMLLNGITLTAIEAKSVGLVSDVYLHDSLKRNVLPMLKSLSIKSREALVATKELIRNPQRARLKYINQCEYLALRQRWEDEDALKYILQYIHTFNHLS